jgi:hypothetical protein
MSWNGLAHAHYIGVCHLAWPNNGLTETFPYVMGRGLTIPWYITALESSVQMWSFTHKPLFAFGRFIKA